MTTALIVLSLVGVIFALIAWDIVGIVGRQERWWR